MSPDPRDEILQRHTPVVIVPRFGALPATEKPGHRYLVAESGLWLEVRRAWLHAIVPVDAPLPEEYGRHRLPFGPMEGKVEYAFTGADVQRLQALFRYDAIAALPDEAAAWGVWNARTRALDYWPLIPTIATPGSITLARPVLEDHLELAVDLHSHGRLEAFFSTTDNDDDAGEVKLAYVAGTLDGEASWAARLCLLGLFIEGHS